MFLSVIKGWETRGREKGRPLAIKVKGKSRGNVTTMN